MTILLTGCAGFIGSAVTHALLAQGHRVIGVDDLNDYYDVSLKDHRLKALCSGPNFTFYQCDIRDAKGLDRIFSKHSIDTVCHLAARAGVRPSVDQPRLYHEVNVLGTLNVFDSTLRHGVARVVFASSSSVYGNSKKLPFSEEDPVDHPISPYAATKKMCELMAYTYYHLYRIPIMGLRFFTVYGPWGRPDMAYFKFTDLIVREKPIDLYCHGTLERDFTYIDDIVQGVVRAVEYPNNGYYIVNLGNHQAEPVTRLVDLLEKELGIRAIRRDAPLQSGDVEATYADITLAKTLLGFQPSTCLEDGIHHFVQWYREYYNSVS